MESGVMLPSLPGHSRLDFEEIRQNLTGMVALALGTVSLFAAGVLLPGPTFVMSRFMGFFLLLCVCIASYFLRVRAPQVARGLLVLGLVGCITWALAFIPWEGVPYFLALATLVGTNLEPRWGLIATAAGTLSLLLVLTPQSAAFWPSLTLLWATLLLSWMATRGLYVVADWAWNSQQQAMRLLGELRKHQQELNHTVVALTEATRRLDRTGYELAVARLRAEEARQLKERFAANISHELRTPLNLILGFSEMIYFRPEVYGDLSLPVGLRRDIHHIYQSSRQLLDLVNDVLDLSRIDGARMTINREPTDLRAVVEESAGTIRNLLRGRPVELLTDVPPELPTLELDRTRIRQVLLNLLNNAARFTRAGRICVTVQPGEKEVLVTVSDTGEGIPTDELPRIFDEFHQVDMSLRRNQEGAGLGLAISKRFVALHGGRIWAESELGRGSQFHFTLPLTPGIVAGSLRQVEAKRPTEGRYQPAVLLVEPDPAVGELLQRHLEGYRVIVVPAEEELSALVARWHPRALLVNVPPSGNDERPSAPLRPIDLPRYVPTIYCSIPSQTWVTQETGVLGSLTKPITREGLLRAMAPVAPCPDVLVVDDDRRFVQLVARYLESAPGAFRPRWAYDGAEGLAQTRERVPDLILLDLMMPGMDGFEFLRRLRADERTAATPVLIVTATDLFDDLLKSHGSEVRIASGRGFGSAEVLRYLQALLAETQVVYPTDALVDSAADSLG
jgi:signal transduction histidine kinase/CheY-like chemotaxis protein